MRVFGYEKRDSDADTQRPISLCEVTFNCSPDQLRALAKFLFHAADLIETHGQEFGHEHLRDWWTDWQPEFADVVVVKQ